MIFRVCSVDVPFSFSKSTCREPLLKGQYRHDQSRPSTGHGIGVLDSPIPLGCVQNRIQIGGFGTVRVKIDQGD